MNIPQLIFIVCAWLVSFPFNTETNHPSKEDMINHSYAWFPSDPPPDMLLPQALLHYELKGSIKSVKVDCYEAYPLGTELILREAFNYTFNPRGYLIHKLQTKGILMGHEYFFQFVADTHLVRIDKFNRLSKDTVDQWRYDYNQSNQFTKIRSYTNGYQWDLMNVYNYEYNDAGKISVLIEEQKWKKAFEKRMYDYDVSGHMIKETIYHDSVLYCTKNRVYKEEKVFQDEQVYASGSVYNTAWTYNKYGNKTKAYTIINSNGKSEIRTITWEYVYDARGNWIKKTVKENGLMYCMEKRVIEYEN